MIQTIAAKKRKLGGTRAAKKLREKGEIPAVIYGHKEANEFLSLPRAKVEDLVRHGAHLVTLEGDLSGSALIKDVQWDNMGYYVTHVDLLRIDVDEQVDVTVAVELKGEAPGVRSGGVLNHLVHEVEIRCLAVSIPEKLELNISSLELGKSLHASDIVLPDKAVLLTPANNIIVSCATVIVSETPAPGVVSAAEPEVITRKPKEDAAEEK